MLDAGTRTVAAIAVMLAAGGCAAPSKEADTAPASAREETCVKLLRELRLYCDEGIREDDRASFRMTCMSRRLAFDRQCL